MSLSQDIKRTATLRYFLTVLGLAAAYFLFAKIGIMFSYDHSSITVVWPPTGIALGAILLFGHRLWPGITLGIVVLMVSNRDPWIAVVGVSIGNTLHAVVGAWMLKRWAGFDRRFERVRDVVALTVLGALVASVISATLGVSSFSYVGRCEWSSFARLWSSWWLGDVMGVILLTPFMLTCALPCSSRWQRRDLIEPIVAFLLLAAASDITFDGWLSILDENLPLAFVPFPFLIWIALRLSMRMTTIAVLLVTVIAVIGTARGFGPFIWSDIRENLMLLVAYLQFVALPALLLAAVSSQHRRADAERSEVIVRFESIARHVPDCFWRTKVNEDGSYSVEYVSPGWDRIWGYKPEDIYRDPELWIKAIASEDVEAARQAFERVQTIHQVQVVVYRIRSKNGQLRWIEDTMSPVISDAGAVTFIEGISRDISDRKLAEERLQRLRSELNDSERQSTITELAGGLAHELNQPLGSILNYASVSADLLESGNADESKLAVAMRGIAKGAERAGQILNRLNEFIQNREPVKSQVDLLALIHETIALVKYQTDRENIDPCLHLPKFLPPVMVDKVLIQQVMVNLLLNAIEAMAEVPPDRRQLKITVLMNNHESVQVSVQDTGCGLKTADLEHLFKPFFTSKSHGLGLGLAISESIVRSHGGVLKAEPHDHEGTTFHFTCPIGMD